MEKFSYRDLLIFLLFILLVLIRFILQKDTPSEGSKILLKGEIKQDVKWYDDKQYLRIDNIGIYLKTDHLLNYGDNVKIEGIYNKEKNRLDNPEILEYKKNEGILLNLRSKITDFYLKSLPQPQSSLVSGVVLGIKSEIPDWFNQDLKKTGMSHVVVASGTNVILIASFLLNLLVKFIKRRLASLISISGIIIYCLISGMDAPVVRAGIMGSLAFLALIFGREYLALRSLILTSFVMLFINPNYIHDLGFVLSFSATLSMILFGKRVKRLVEKLYLPNVFKESLYTSLSAQILVIPILIYTFGYVSILSPVINVLTLWTIPLITVWGMVAGLVGLISPVLGLLILYLIYPFALFFTQTISFFSDRLI